MTTATRAEPGPFAEMVEAQGSSLEELEELSGLSRHTLSRLAAGGRPGETTARHLAAVLRVTPEDVLNPTRWLAQQQRLNAARRTRVEWAFRMPATGHENWRDSAPCRHADPELFWPEAGVYPAAALALCDDCPVLGDCRELCLSQGVDAGGVWFGTTVNERREHRPAHHRSAPRPSRPRRPHRAITPSRSRLSPQGASS